MATQPDLTKKQWPEFISRQLGIPTVHGTAGPWHSAGDTTDKVWFERMCEALSIPYPGNRTVAMQRLVEAVGQSWDTAALSSEVTPSKGGGNLKVAAFERLWSGITGSRVGRNLLVQAAAMTQASESNEAVDHVTDADADLADRHSLQLIRLRQGQPAFRATLLEAYGYRCAITGTDLPETLEAAHVTPHAKGGPMTVDNGILLRADLHNLFDLGLISIEHGTWEVLVAEKVLATDAGLALSQGFLRPPEIRADWPSKERLQNHRRLAKL